MYWMYTEVKLCEIGTVNFDKHVRQCIILLWICTPLNSLTEDIYQYQNDCFGMPASET